MTRAHRRMLRLWVAQSGACHWCGLPMQRDGDCPGGVFSPWYGSVEHLLRRGEGGYEQNLAAAHVLCNELREVVSPADFIAYVHSESFRAFYRSTVTRPVTMRQRPVRLLIRRLARASESQRRSTVHG